MKKAFVVILFLSFVLANGQGKVFSPKFGSIGYFGSFLSTPFGLGISSMTTEGRGRFLKIGFNKSIPEDRIYTFSEKLSEGWNDEYKGIRKENFTILGGVIDNVFPQGKKIHEMIYYGGGITLVSKYKKYRDASEILSDTGEYYIDENANVYLIRLSGGVIFPIELDNKNMLYFHIGLNLFPAEFSLGLEYGWARRLISS